MRQSETAADFMLAKYQSPETSISGLAADLQHGEAIRERMRRVPDHEDGMIAKDAQDGLQETRFVVGVKVRGCFVGQQT